MTSRYEVVISCLHCVLHFEAQVDGTYVLNLLLQYSYRYASRRSSENIRKKSVKCFLSPNFYWIYSKRPSLAKSLARQIFLVYLYSGTSFKHFLLYLKTFGNIFLIWKLEEETLDHWREHSSLKTYLFSIFLTHTKSFVFHSELGSQNLCLHKSKLPPKSNSWIYLIYLYSNNDEFNFFCHDRSLIKYISTVVNIMKWINCFGIDRFPWTPENTITPENIVCDGVMFCSGLS